MGAIWWGTYPPHFFQTMGYTTPCPTYIFLFRFCIRRGFKIKCDVCHGLCEYFFILDVTHTQVDVGTEFGVVSLVLILL